MNSCFCFSLLKIFGALVSGYEEFYVLNIEDLPFPLSYADSAAVINITHSQKISEFTVCYRFFVISYNNGWQLLIQARSENSRYFYRESLGGGDTGFEYEGYQALSYLLFRNVTGEGLGGRAHPVYHHTLLARNVPTSKWVSSCNSYS